MLSDTDRKIVSDWLGSKTASLLYRASRDGYQVSEFHSRCDNKGPTLVILKSCSGYIFGGYAPKHWDSTSGHIYAGGSFLFTLVNPSKCLASKFEVSPLICGMYVQEQVFSFNVICRDCLATHGPCFASAMHVTQQATNLVVTFSRLVEKNYTRFIFTGEVSSALQELEVFQIQHE